MDRPPAIALMGPTASGKSALALEWAERLQGEIVSVDSALVYRGLDIGAAKPTREEQARIPHHLLDVREPWQPYSALHGELAAIDPVAAARIHATDAQRIQRALEVWRLSGRPISPWQQPGAAGRRPAVRAALQGVSVAGRLLPALVGRLAAGQSRGQVGAEIER